MQGMSLVLKPPLKMLGRIPQVTKSVVHPLEWPNNYWFIGDLNQTERMLRVVIDQEPSARALELLAFVNEAKGKIPLAIDVIDKAIIMAENEEDELRILETFMPQQLTENELEQLVSEVIDEIGS